jgi:plasmid stability protein
MKNITVTLPDEIYLEARVWAARHETSVSALVRDFLASLSDFEPVRKRFAVREAETPTPLYCETVMARTNRKRQTPPQRPIESSGGSRLRRSLYN